MLVSVVMTVKVILANSHGINEPDDPSLPCRLEASLRAPGFMQMAFVLMHGGSEELVVKAITVSEFEPTLEQLRNHPRLTLLVVTN